MGKFVELDHTSSGVQVAAALSLDESMARLVNLTQTDSKNDLYSLVASETNKKFKELGVDFELDRPGVKAAVVAKVYGASKANDSKALSNVLKVDKKDHKEVFKAFSDVLDETMGGVVQVQKYFKHVADSMKEAGYDSFDLMLADGAYYNVEKEGGWEKTSVCNVRFNGSKGGARKVQFVVPETPKSFNSKALVAAFVQSFDADVLARTKNKMVMRGVPLYAKHDAYLVPPAHKEELVEAAQLAMYESFSNCNLDDLRDDLVARYDVDLESFDSLFGYGNYSLDQVLNAPFLLA